MKRVSKAIAVSIILILVLCLFPVIYRYKDGGSVCYRSLVYEITRWHQMSDTEPDGFMDGLEVRIFGVLIYEKHYE